jgi:transcriptional regulator with XRE-family HTH domain
MGEFANFLLINGLKRKDIAEYLGVSGAFITQIAKDERPLPSEKLALIKSNAYGWDISMLIKPQATLQSLQSEAMANNALIDYLQKKVAELENKIDKLNSEKADLLQENAVLRYENLMLTSKNREAQDAEDSLSADNF